MTAPQRGLCPVAELAVPFECGTNRVSGHSASAKAKVIVRLSISSASVAN